MTDLAQFIALWLSTRTKSWRVHDANAVLQFRPPKLPSPDPTSPSPTHPPPRLNLRTAQPLALRLGLSLPARADAAHRRRRRAAHQAVQQVVVGPSGLDAPLAHQPPVPLGAHEGLRASEVIGQQP